jgi:hypothetical protein
VGTSFRASSSSQEETEHGKPLKKYSILYLIASTEYFNNKSSLSKSMVDLYAYRLIDLVAAQFTLTQAAGIDAESACEFE